MTENRSAVAGGGGGRKGMEGRITQGYQHAFGWWNVLTILLAIIDSLVYRSVNLIKLYTFNRWSLFHDNYTSIKQALKMSRTGVLAQKALASLSSIMDYNSHWRKAGGRLWVNVQLVGKELPPAEHPSETIIDDLLCSQKESRVYPVTSRNGSSMKPHPTCRVPFLATLFCNEKNWI